MATLVLLCSHNGERFIREQIASIRSQTKPVDAIHVFDFGSKDGTVGILRQLAADQLATPLHVHTHADAPGASISFFRAMAQMADFVAPTDCVFLADQDDFWLENKVERMRAAFERELAQQPNGLVAVFHDVVIVDERLQATTNTYYTGNPFSVPRDLASDRLLLANPVVGHTIAASGALLRTVTSKVSCVDYCMHDWALVLVASRIGRIGFEAAALSLYRQHDANVLGAFGRRRPIEIIGRTMQFARRVTRQAVAFGRDLERIEADVSMPGSSTPGLAADRWLAQVALHAPRLAPLLLSLMAMARGPTWQRRALGIALILSAFRAPLGSRAGK